LTFVLDTNVVSALMRGDANVVNRLSLLSRDVVFVPQPVLAEIEYGLERLSSSKKKTMLRKRFARLSAELLRCDWTDDVSAAFGRIKATLEKRGSRIEDFDAAIAAHAVVRDAVLVTANVRHLARVPGVRVEDWSQP
jgi:tRNA(fMet)-specific endonuclease VapC